MRVVRKGLFSSALATISGGHLFRGDWFFFGKDLAEKAISDELLHDFNSSACRYIMLQKISFVFDRSLRNLVGLIKSFDCKPSHEEGQYGR